MSRPKIICHMHTLLNGKVDGIANITDVGMRAQRRYFDIMLGENRFYAKHRGWLSGSGTSEAMMGGPREIDFPEPTDPVPTGDFIGDPDAEMHYFAVDRTGKLAWESNVFEYFDVKAHIVELIPASVSDAFKAHLRSINVSYIIAGDEELDMAAAVDKIGRIFSVDELMLGGGPNLNWSMIRDGLCDELSLVLMPTADAQNHTNSLFESHEKFSTPAPYEFKLKSAEPLEDGSVWMRYDIVGEIVQAS